MIIGHGGDDFLTRIELLLLIALFRVKINFDGEVTLGAPPFVEGREKLLNDAFLECAGF